MRQNRSVPRAHAIPVLSYSNVAEAADWLCAAFGFTIRLIIPDHRIQLNVDETGAAVILRQMDGPHGQPQDSTVLIRIDNADEHCRRAREHGARILTEPTTHAYGERQYNVQDFAGHRWDFTQTIEDRHPDDWGGIAVNL